MNRPYQHAVAADVHRLPFSRYLLSSKERVMGTKFEGEANSASTFRATESTQSVVLLADLALTH